MAPVRRKNILLSEKMKIVTRARNGESLHSLERTTGYQRSQIRGWIRNVNKMNLFGNGKREHSRVKGGGRKPKFPQVEEELLAWFREQRSKKLVVNYSTIRREATTMAINKNVENFACSNKWIANFCRRNRISSRKITHQGQEDNVPKGEMYLKVKHFLDEVTIKAAGIPAENIFNMDETPCFFDMANSRTLHFTGEKTVDGLDTGHSKNRFTTVLCISASGKFIKSLIIFKGLKKILK